MTKRTKIQSLFALLLAFVMVVGGFFSPVFAEEAEDAEDAEEVEDVEAEDAEDVDAETEATEQEERINYDDPYIADREIVVQAYVDDIGVAWPENFDETEVGKVLKDRTGVSLKVQYQAADSDRQVLNMHIMSDSISADAILTYLNNSARPEFPILLKGAQEGLFYDLSDILPETLVYSKYYEDGYLPKDSYKNIVFREDFDGAVYLLHLGIPRYDDSMKFDPQEDMIGGMFIQSDICEALDIDPREIHTADQFYDLLVAIRDGGFEDEHGQPVTPLGPKFWGGSVDAMDYFLRPFNWGVSKGFNITEDGEILHEVETDYAMEKVNYVRKLLDEGLIHPEFFTMDSTRAEEVSRAKSVGIIGDVHNYVEIIYGSDDWLPLGPLNDYTGEFSNIAGGKGGYGCLAINAKAEKPEEIMKFFDYLSTYEGKLLGDYGVEGVSYEFDEDGNPRLVQEALEAVNNDDQAYMINKIGAGFGGGGNYVFSFARTDEASKYEFGENRPGSSAGEMFEGAIRVAEFAPQTYRYVPGLQATAYLNDPEMEEIKPQMALLNYPEQLVAAFFAPSEEDAEAILDSFEEQFIASGGEEFKAHLQEIYEEDPEAINFY